MNSILTNVPWFSVANRAAKVVPVFTHTRFHRRAVIAAAAAPLFTAAVSYGTNYAATNLTSLGYSGLTASGLNDFDQVVGYYSGTGGHLPFIYTPGVGLSTIAGVGAGSTTTAVGINDSGVVVGNDGTTGGGFVYSNGSTTAVSPISASGKLTFLGINAGGTAVGNSTVAGGATQVFTDATATGTLSNVGAGFTGASANSYAAGINDSGTVLGLGIPSAAVGTATAHYLPFTATPQGGGYSYVNVGTAVETKYPPSQTYADYSTNPLPHIDAQGNVAGTIGSSTTNTYGNYPTSNNGFIYTAATGVVSSIPVYNPSVFALADVAGTPQLAGSYVSHGLYTFTYQNGKLSDVTSAVSGYTVYSIVAENSHGDLLVTGNDSSGAAVNLLLTTINGMVTYTGQTSGSWDTTSNNFTPTLYANGYNVTFDDSATGPTTINIPSAVSPGNVTFNNNTKNYTFNGSGIGGGANNTFTLNGTGTVTLNNANTFTGVTNVTAGTLVVGPAGSIGSTTINVSSGAKLVLQSAGALSVETYQYSNIALNVAGTVSAKFTGGVYSFGFGTAYGNGLYIAGTTNNWTGTFDLGANAMVLSNTKSTLAAVTNQVKSGYAGGLWNGTGITSSAAAADSTHTTAIGVIINASNQVVNQSELYTTFHGTSVQINNILVGYTYYGDANLDGQVDGSDYTLIDNTYNTELASPGLKISGWYFGDFNYDGVVDGSDYTLIDNAFNTQGGNLGGGVGDQGGTFVIIADQIATSQVPEPASLAVFGMSMSMCLGRRKRRR